MSLRYRDNAGREVIVASLTPGGDIESGAVATRSGSFNITFNGSATSEGNVAVTFDQPMPDADYDVSFSYNGQWTGVSLYANQKTANGFNVCYANIVSSTATRTYNYRAIKTYTVQHAAQNAESIANLEAMVPTGAGSGNKLVTKSYVDNADNAIDSRLDNIEDAMPTTASITNKLATKNDVDNVQIDALGDIADVEVTGVQSGQTILWDSDDSKWVAGQAGKVYTAGDGIEISTLDKISVDDEYVPLTFVGTKAQWDELTVSQKAKYTLVNITDDPATGGAVVVDRVAEGNMNPVTSNAVAANLNKIEIVYDANKAILTRIGGIYQLRFNGADASQYAQVMTDVADYLPSSLSAVLYTLVGGRNYLATFSASSKKVYVTGTYNADPVDFETINHALYGDLIWIRNKV